MLSESDGQAQTHDPIRVFGDSDFLRPQSGVTLGDGTYGNPFIIEGWDIDAASTHGIHIRNTQSYFVIRNVSVHGGYPNAGIFLESAANGIIQDTTLTDNQYGVWLSASHQNFIIHNAIRNNSIAILLNSSTSNTVADNQLSENSQYGLWLSSGSNSNTVTGNNMSSITNGSGALVSSSSNNLIEDNLASNNRWFGLSLTFSENNILQSNTADASHVGIVFVESSGNVATGNFASRNDYGIGLEDPNIDNALLTADNNITSNTIRDSNAVGLYTFRAVRTLLYDNRLENLFNAVDDGAENTWYVSKRPGTNILGGPFLGGNYYSNYVGTDQDGDGIGDSPHTGIGGGAQTIDNYPLVLEQPAVVHDIAALEFAVQPSTARVGAEVNMTATVFNQGTATETFSVRFSYNSTLLPWAVQVSELQSWAETTVTFVWYTADLAPADYAVRAEAAGVSGEIDTTNNISPVALLSLSPNNPPNATFALTTADPVARSPVAFDATGSYDLDGDALQFLWDFGDGTIGSGSIVSHVYDFSGTYMVVLTVIDDHGGSSSAEYSLTLPSYPPAAPVIVAATVTSLGTELTWTIPVSNGGRPITGYRIYRGASPTSLSLHATVENTTSYVDLGPLTRGQTYYYAIGALNDVGESEFSEVKDVLIPFSDSGSVRSSIGWWSLANITLALALPSAVVAVYALSRRRKKS